MVRAALVLATCSLLLACSSGEDALQRGDSFWADSNYTQALAEYRQKGLRWINVHLKAFVQTGARPFLDHIRRT